MSRFGRFVDGSVIRARMEAKDRRMNAELSRAAEKRKRKAAIEAHRAEVYRAVDRRDAGKCRACGRRCSPFALGLLDRAEHHHVVLRSAGGQDETRNICLLCADCHADRHMGRLSVFGDADGLLTFERTRQ